VVELAPVPGLVAPDFWRLTDLSVMGY